MLALAFNCFWPISRIHCLSAAGSVSGASVSATGNISAGGVISGASLTATGNINAGGTGYVNGEIVTLTHAGAWNDDSQIDDLRVCRILTAGQERCVVAMQEIAA